MKTSRLCMFAFIIICPAFAFQSLTQKNAASKPPLDGSQNEKRFPPLKIPDGFKATLFACDPMIEYPSAIALGPRRGTIFVAADYMTGLGREIIRRDEIRLLDDKNGDGYADKATVFAKGFNSIQGLTFHDGVLYVMHAPYLTALQDADGDGKADERRDLLNGLGLPPEKNPVRLHCANGLVMGHDGWLYLALGDHGCDVKRPEGDRLIHQGGAILRCRADGRDLHVFAFGLRNIYDVALDAEGNVFVRDNENDGGQYMVRVCHSFFGADHGYPYLFKERPSEALPPLADLGRGSSAGGLCYLESSFPSAYQGNLFFCEWGRAVVRCHPQQKGSAFGPVTEHDFASGAADDPYGFKPTDLVVDRDGALFIADWADGQRPKRGRGRIYRITAANAKTKSQPNGKADGDWIGQLDSPSYLRRMAAQSQLAEMGRDGQAAIAKAWKAKRLGVLGRVHAVWIITNHNGRSCVPKLLEIARTDPSAVVRMQAVRAIADLCDPILSENKLSANKPAAKIASQIAGIAKGQHPSVVRAIIVALGRLQWPDAPRWISEHVHSFDAATAHAAMQTMRRPQNWPAVLSLLDAPTNEAIRSIALRALADRHHPAIVDGLIQRMGKSSSSKFRQEYADLLTRVYKKPKAWEYWGYRPAPRLANTVGWSKTDAIAATLDKVLSDGELTVRQFILQRMQRENIPVRLESLSRWLAIDRDEHRVATILASLSEQPAKAALPVLLNIVGTEQNAVASRLAALKIVSSALDKSTSPLLLKLAAELDDGPVLAQVLRNLSQWPNVSSSSLLLRKLSSPTASVRAAAIYAVAEMNITQAAPRIETLLNDKSNDVRIAAAIAVGKLQIRTAADELLTMAKSDNVDCRNACLRSLHQLKDERALPLAVKSLGNPTTHLASLRVIRKFGDARHAASVADAAVNNQSMEILPITIRTLAKWRLGDSAKRNLIDQMMARVQGSSGLILHWRLAGPIAENNLPSAIKEHWSAATGLPDSNSKSLRWKPLFADGVDGRTSWTAGDAKPKQAWLAVSDVFLPASQNVQFLTSTDGRFDVWLDGERVYRQQKITTFRSDSDRFEIKLAKGTRRLIIVMKPSRKTPRFHLRFRRKSAKADHEKLIQYALSSTGNVTGGRELFLNVKKSQCLKCHRMGEGGERIGPDLSGVGKRFSRVYLIESILEPSRTIAPSYETQFVELKDGRVLSGTKIAETKAVLILGDKEGKQHKFSPSSIVTRSVVPQSTMPDGLEQTLTRQEFVDLIAFLQNQK